MGEKKLTIVDDEQQLKGEKQSVDLHYVELSMDQLSRSIHPAITFRGHLIHRKREKRFDHCDYS